MGSQNRPLSLHIDFLIVLIVVSTCISSEAINGPDCLTCKGKHHLKSLSEGDKRINASGNVNAVTVEEGSQNKRLKPNARGQRSLLADNDEHETHNPYHKWNANPYSQPITTDNNGNSYPDAGHISLTPVVSNYPVDGLNPSRNDFRRGNGFQVSSNFHLGSGISHQNPGNLGTGSGYPSTGNGFQGGNGYPGAPLGYPAIGDAYPGSGNGIPVSGFGHPGSGNAYLDTGNGYQADGQSTWQPHVVYPISGNPANTWNPASQPVIKNPANPWEPAGQPVNWNPATTWNPAGQPVNQNPTNLWIPVGQPVNQYPANTWQPSDQPVDQNPVNTRNPSDQPVNQNPTNPRSPIGQLVNQYPANTWHPSDQPVDQNPANPWNTAGQPVNQNPENNWNPSDQPLNQNPANLWNPKVQQVHQNSANTWNPAAQPVNENPISQYLPYFPGNDTLAGKSPFTPTLQHLINSVYPLSVSTPVDQFSGYPHNELQGQQGFGLSAPVLGMNPFSAAMLFPNTIGGNPMAPSGLLPCQMLCCLLSLCLSPLCTSCRSGQGLQLQQLQLQQQRKLGASWNVMESLNSLSSAARGMAADKATAMAPANPQGASDSSLATTVKNTTLSPLSPDPGSKNSPNPGKSPEVPNGSKVTANSPETLHQEQTKAVRPVVDGEAPKPSLKPEKEDNVVKASKSVE